LKFWIDENIREVRNSYPQVAFPGARVSILADSAPRCQDQIQAESPGSRPGRLTGGTMRKGLRRVRQTLAGLLWPDYPKLEAKYLQLQEVHQRILFCRARLEAKLQEIESSEVQSQTSRDLFRSKLVEVKQILDDF
jgi:hypothetical protein